jgi:hypothetical protein
MISKTKTTVKIPREEWEKLRKNPSFSEAIELLEDVADLEAAKSIKGKDISLTNYLQKRGLRTNT